MWTTEGIIRVFIDPSLSSGDWQASVFRDLHFNGGQALSHAVEQRGYEHVRQTPPHHLGRG